MHDENSEATVGTKKSQLGGLRWYWQLAICFTYSLVVLIIVIAVVDQGRPSQSFYKGIGLIWPVGIIGSWLVSRPRRCFLVSAVVFAITAFVVFGIAAAGSGIAAIASRIFLIDQADVFVYLLAAIIIGIVNLIYRAFSLRAPK